jgi:UPF0271 protein
VPTVDLNSDLGESYGVWRLGDDEALLELVSSANLACGYHGGDPSTMRRVCGAAASNGVVIGAQVSYPDLAGFGRRFIDMEPDELCDAVIYQLGALEAIARAEGAAVRYLKPHGALYHATVQHERQADAVVRAVLAVDRDLAVLGAPGSLLLKLAAEAGLDAVPEAFADRAYRPDGTLLPRSEPGAVLHDAHDVTARAVALALERTVLAVDGSHVTVHARSICVHGDTPGAVTLAAAIRGALEAEGVEVRPFVESN